MRPWILAASFALVFACNGKDDDHDHDHETDADADADADSDADTDTDTDSDADADCELTANRTMLNTKQTATFAVMQGGQNVTSGATLSSSDDMVFKFYEPPVGQPLEDGSVTVTADLAGGVSCDLDVDITLAAAGAGDLIINEFLANGVSGDPNGDTTFDDDEDEFIELYNVSAATLDLEGVTISETDFPALPRHTFPAGTLVKAGESIVVFGGGDASSLTATNTSYQIADNADPGVLFYLNLGDTGDTIEVTAADGTTTITMLEYGGSTAVPDGQAGAVSVCREPEITGTSFVVHTSATGATGDYSPGTLADGTPFPGYDDIYTP